MTADKSGKRDERPVATDGDDPASLRPGHGSASTAGRSGYHHGSLRDALIDAVYDAIRKDGYERFSLADACRAAGVSTAAPYKHFKDREEILAAALSRAFIEMRDGTLAAVAKAGRGTLAGMVAMGHSYVDFAVREEHWFRVMFVRDKRLTQAPLTLDSSQECFAHVIGEVEYYCQCVGHPGDPRAIAIRLWTFVHGVACLHIDAAFETASPETDTAQLIVETTPLLLSDGPIPPSQFSGP
ncbi:MAG: TetR/AcrR family transcriptional regulator [Pseudomonadota bacterium]